VVPVGSEVSLEMVSEVIFKHSNLSIILGSIRNRCNGAIIPGVAVSAIICFSGNRNGQLIRSTLPGHVLDPLIDVFNHCNRYIAKRTYGKFCNRKYHCLQADDVTRNKSVAIERRCNEAEL
jgi:hypothetical protein